MLFFRHLHLAVDVLKKMCPCSKAWENKVFVDLRSRRNEGDSSDPAWFASVFLSYIDKANNPHY